MAKLPGIADLGPTPNADTTRPVATYDTSALARGGQALAQGAQVLGKGISAAGEGVGDLAIDEDRWQYAKANSDFLSRQVDLNNTTKQDPNYGPDNTGKTLPERYSDNLNTIVDGSAQLIQSPAMRDRFMTAIAPKIAAANAGAQTYARGLENNANIAYVDQQGDGFINKAVATPDDDTRTQIIDTYNQLVDGLAAKRAITPVQALQKKQAWAKQYATADLLSRADTDPQGVINELRAAPGSGADITNRILQVEGTGKNASSSATGTGQFIDSTWLDVLKRNRPDLAQGRSDAQLLALRSDNGLARDMTDALRQENATALTGAGVDATPGAQYLAHFLGAKGAIAVLQADPNQPVADALAKSVGQKAAAQMVAANPSVLGGKLAGSVTQWANGKMGGASPGGGSIYDLLAPDVRATLLSHAENQLQKQRVGNLSDFKGQIEDSQAEAMATGDVKAPIPQSTFIANLGADLGPKAYTQYQSNVQLGRDVANVAKLDPDQQSALLDTYKPEPGEGFAAGMQRLGIVQKAIAQSNKEKLDDPGGFAISRLPATSDAYADFSKVASDPTAQPADKQAAARKFADSTLLEQGNVGLPPDQRRILPKSYVTAFNKRIASAADSDDPQARVGIIAQVQQEAAQWGNNWPAVMRQLAPSAQPVVRAIAAGADPAAMTRLLSLDPKETVKSIVGEQDETKFSDLNKALNTEMAPFMRSLVGRQKDRDYPAIYGVAQKLGALYVRDGDAAPDAAQKAFTAVLGDQYDFRDTYMIPKTAGVSADDVQKGTLAARGQLAQFGAKPPIDDMPGRSNPSAVDLGLVGRNGSWVSEPNGAGLNLVYNDKFVKGQDGKPLMLPWSQLASVGQTMTPAHREALAKRGVFTAPKFDD